MPVSLTDHEQALLEGTEGPATALAMRIVVASAELLGASCLVPIASAHIDGCLYHGDGGVEFAEVLVEGEGQVAVPTTLNVGALDLLHPDRVTSQGHERSMALRLMNAYLALGCASTWTCAPYQGTHRPVVGAHVAWGESNAVAFVNSVLGARTNRYGDFLDIACALTGRAPLCGLHTDQARQARIVVRTDGLSEGLRDADVFFPVLGAWLGREVGNTVAVIDGLPAHTTEDRLKALGASAASTGAVALFHVVGVTPEAGTLEAALGGEAPEREVRLTPADVLTAARALSTASGDQVDAIALGSPHFSLDEFAQLGDALAEHVQPGVALRVPFYVCTGRDVLDHLERTGLRAPLEAAGITIVVDTCVVVAPILPEPGGVLMTNSGKFAHYGPGTIGYDVIYGSLDECVRSAVEGSVVRDPEAWT